MPAKAPCSTSRQNGKLGTVHGQRKAYAVGMTALTLVDLGQQGGPLLAQPPAPTAWLLTGPAKQKPQQTKALVLTHQCKCFKMLGLQ